MILQFRFSDSGFSPAMYPSSVVQTGVKFFGCENRMAQPFPIHSWKLIRPCVVSAVKLGASLLILNAITHLPIVWNRQTIVRSRCPTFAAHQPQGNLPATKRHQERGRLAPAEEASFLPRLQGVHLKLVRQADLIPPLSTPIPHSPPPPFPP